jgi:phage terminase large subunit-like protein
MSRERTSFTGGLSPRANRPKDFVEPDKDELRKLYDPAGYEKALDDKAFDSLQDSVKREVSDRFKKYAKYSRSCSKWKQEAHKVAKDLKASDVEQGKDALIRYCLQRAYLDSNDLSDSFYNFAKDIVGYPDLDNNNHIKMCETIAGPEKYSLLLACRDTFKSSLACAAYPSFIVGRDYFLNGETSTVRILLASEVMALAKRNLTWAKQIMDWDPRGTFKLLCGDHRGQTGWTWSEILSRHRVDPRIGGPTIGHAGIDSDKTGFHYDYIICDDIQAERQSSSREQIDVVWNFYQLLFSLLEKQPRKIGVKLLVVGTRWHYDDLYQRIETGNQAEPDETKFKITYLPDKDPKTGALNFPDRLSQKVLDDMLRKHGASHFACQYRLNPIAEEERIFKKKWVNFAKPQMYNQKLNVYTSGDFAYTEYNLKAVSRRNRDADYTVIFTVGVDERWNYVFMDWFRERVSKRKAIEELYRQAMAHKSRLVILQKYDRSQIADVVEQVGFDLRDEDPTMRVIVPEWVGYPPRQKKEDRIKTMLQPLFQGSKVFLMPNMQWWVDSEVLDFPKARHDDGLDCFANIAKIAKPPAKRKMSKNINPVWLHCQRLEAGLDPVTGEKDGGDWKNT